MNSVETEGKTIDEAVAAALAQLQADRDRVTIEVLTQPAKGFLGIGGKKARVRVSLRAPQSRPAEAQRTPERRPEPPRMSEPVRKPEPPRPPEPPRMSEPPRRPEPVRMSEPARRPEPPRMSEPTRRPEPARMPDEAFDAVTLHPEQGEKARETLQEILRLMETDATVTPSQQGTEFVLTLTGRDSAALIGRNGDTLDALEYVLNRIVTRSDESDAHLTLDAEGYRERRRRNLENLALRLGERAKRRKRPVSLSPLSPRDRRVIHLALEGDPLVSTRSMGRGYFRRLFIMPEEGPRRERGRGGPRMLSGDA